MIPNLICPYCNSKLKGFNTEKEYFTVYCQCETYPVLNNVVYLIKDDDLSQRKIVNLIQQKKYSLALWKALSKDKKSLRIITFLVLIAKKNFNISFETAINLYYLLSIGKERSWFKYLKESEQRENLKTTLDQIHFKNKSIILDVGCGFGHLEKKLLSTTNDSIIYALDKSFLSLTIARLFNSNNQIFFICFDIETTPCFEENYFSNIIILDTFAWVRNKKTVLKNLAGILNKNGQILIVNIHEQTKKTLSWGYGITSKNLKKTLSPYFKKIIIFNTNRKTEFKKLSKTSFSCKAEKK